MEQTFLGAISECLRFLPAQTLHKSGCQRSDWGGSTPRLEWERSCFSHGGAVTKLLCCSRHRLYWAVFSHWCSSPCLCASVTHISVPRIPSLCTPITHTALHFKMKADSRQRWDLIQISIKLKLHC